MTILIIIFITASCIPSLKLLASERHLPRAFDVAALLLLINAALVSCFVILVQSDAVSLSRSLAFSAFGFPLCFLALILLYHHRDYAAPGQWMVINGSLGVVAWLGLITLH